MSTGIGYDCHRLVEGRALIIGGVRLEHDRGPEGHSDADVLTHAIIDALLGATALGDIGQHFPDTDPRFAGADSIELLRQALEMTTAAGFAVTHVDATVMLERPKLAPFREAIRDRLAEALGLEPGHVSVKATRGEGIGFVGREEGVAALAVASVIRGESDLTRPGPDASSEPRRLSLGG
ncbi:MAG: 2-C-methyl-D-erythritol 2,4-cyclodiphosphate synthase [Actinomycetota bacterium]|nr:2-C-methyl-D-erythritol 2,4-cyclodiphosphate synthase [Actinomycetota bacterium]